MLADHQYQHNNRKAMYLCSSLTLQDQFMEDFEWAHLVKGRSNYPALHGKTAEDCTKDHCWHGERVCPYDAALSGAEAANLTVTNMTQFLSNTKLRLVSGKLLVVDEADVFEREMQSRNTLTLTHQLVKDVGGRPVPKKGSHMSTIRTWLRNFEIRYKRWIAAKYPPSEPELQKQRRNHLGRHRTITQILEIDGKDDWVRETSHGALQLKRVWSHDWAKPRIWDQWTGPIVLMTGSVVSPRSLVEGIGLDWNETAVVKVDSQIPVEQRPIVVEKHRLVDMSYKNRNEGWPVMVRRAQEVLDLYPHENTLVHTVSYNLAALLAMELDGGEREVITYQNTRERAKALRRFKEEGGVLVAPSMDRGVDFPHEECRLVLVCKIPYPSLGDRVVSQRLRSRGIGQRWYDTETIRGLIQMSGRAVRGPTDHAVTIVLDDAWGKLYGKNRRLFPEWWREAVRYELPA